MLTPKQVARFHEQGFLSGGRVLSSDEVEILRAEMQRVMDHHGKGGRQPVSLSAWKGKDDTVLWQIVNIWEASDPFRKLLSRPEVVEVVVQLLQPRELRVWHDQIQYKPAGQGGVNMWHQDSPYWGTLQPKDQQLTAWFALDDVGEDNGCMSMIPGSHRWGVQIDFLHSLKDFQAMPAQFENHPIEVRLCPVQKGEVHFHHPLTWHGSHGNRSGRPRRAIAVHYMTDRTVFDAENVHLMKPHIHVRPGEKIEGEHFPLVWSQATTPAAASGTR